VEKSGQPRAKDVLKPLEGAERFDEIVALAARRGFFSPSAEIYGGLAGFYDYGPLGAVMMRRMVAAWINYWTRREGFFLVDTPTIGPEAVFRASGHLDKFADPALECTKCGASFRPDEVAGAIRLGDGDLPAKLKLLLDTLKTTSLAKLGAEGSVTLELVACPKGALHDFGDLASAKQVNLMFSTQVGSGAKTTAYLRPETAQGIFWLFPALLRHNRGRVPFGVAQVGLGYRNEIAPRNALFRMREFHMAEVEVFFDPSTKKWPRFKDLEGMEATFHDQSGAIHLATFREMVNSGVIRSEIVAHFAAAAYELVRSFGVPDERMRLRQHMPGEMAHYAQDCWDLELETSLGWIECAGIADRGGYDLTRHQEYSGADMSVFVPFDAPKMVEVDGFSPDFRALGPLFRAEAAAVGEAVKAATAASLQPDGSLKVKVAGTDVVVDPSLFKRETRTEKKSGDSFVPHVVEPSFGLDRIFFALMDAAFARVEKEGEPYTILRLDPRVAPITACVFPLMPKDGMETAAEQVHLELSRAGIPSQYDDSGSIGKRYARADEAGVPFCITVDYESLTDNAATLRLRDTQAQERVPIATVGARIQALLAHAGGGH
jgi:glycyl-tRNA synthetase